MGGVLRPQVLIVTALFGVSACVASDSPVASTVSGVTEASTVGSIAPPTQPVSTAPTTAASTSAPVEVPSARATATQFVLPADAPDAVIESVADLVVNDADTTAFLAGTFRPGPGQPGVARVWHANGRTRSATVELDLGTADESWADGIATRGDRVVVAGTTRTGESTTGVIWESDDGGQTFGPPVTIDDTLTSLADVAFDEEGLVVVGAVQPSGQPSTPVVLLGSGSDWESAELVGPEGSRATSVTVDGSSVLVTGSVGEYDEETAVLWVSGDSGGEFAQIDTISSYRTVGPVALNDGTYVLSARGKQDNPMAILTSVDGVTWTATEVTLFRDDEDFGNVRRGGGWILANPDGSYLADIASPWGFTANIAADGRGEAISYFSGRLQSAENTLLFELGGQRTAVSNTERSFSILTQTGSDWEYSGPVTAEGPPVVWTKLNSIGTDLVAITTAYPKVTEQGSSHGPSNRWSRFGGVEFATVSRADLPPTPSKWTGNDTTEVALYTGADDPGDVEEAHNRGGTGVRMRQVPDGEWSDQDLILTGPGGDTLYDIDPLGPGFVAVGARTQLDADDDETATPVVLEYLDQGWATASLPPLEGAAVYLYRVMAAPSGIALATGSTDASGTSELIAVARGTDGVWSQVTLPVSDANAELLYSQFVDDAFHLLIDDGGMYALLQSTDAQTFERVDLEFPDPFTMTAWAAVNLDGASYVVGTSGVTGARRVSLWELQADGSLSPVEISGDTPIGEIKVTDVRVVGNELWIVGLHAGLGVAWRLGVESSVTPGSNADSNGERADTSTSTG